MTTRMKAPKGTTSANIQGHTYTIKKDGIIKVVSDNHLEDLTRHGFTPYHDENPDELRAQIENWGNDDKDELVEFIEERGGTADNSMGTKKLRRLALEAAGLNEEDED